jgi:hypothetical protein
VTFVRADVSLPGTRAIKKDELFGVRHGKALQQDLMKDGENASVGADAEAES